MSKRLLLVYQDCPLCGDRGKIVAQKIATHGLNIRKVSFASDEGAGLIHTAVFEKGIKTLPFFTDGEKFSAKIDDFLESEKPNKKAKKSKGAKDESVDTAD